MKLSVRAGYAVRALLALARHPRDQWISVNAIAAQQNLPRRFLEQILHDLRTPGIVESRRGVTGGYRLAVPAEHITLARVIRHFDGALAPIGCVSEKFYEKCSCIDESRCPLRAVMKEVRDVVSELMDRTTLAELREREVELQRAPLKSVDFMI